MPIPSDAALSRLARQVGQRLSAARLSIATAESCTGGLIAKTLTDIAGSSDYFERGWVTYSNESKVSELGVDRAALTRHGAVSEAVALAMVRGALERSRAQHAVAVTGIAGPAGGSAEKPVGLVWIGWGRRQGDHHRVHAMEYRFRGGRDAVRRQAVSAALKGLLDP
ncbi:MAG TPA: nicotinamide-nucleotide amidohydrolase family protein [Steroidobacteraceae bacterium]|jgi:nicotinamide-nucleotide amidase|nr:nicotinamide-nucleotide amidohydrolase family protein [Steroidobacteraceae bacterium]